MVIPQEQSREGLLRRLAAYDEASIESVLGIRLECGHLGGLDAKACALVRIGALLGIDATAPAYQWAVGMAFAAGATGDEIVGTLIVVAPTVGVARVVSAAPALGLAIGYDIDAALERRDD
jgi:alkylhydroperoxidase/carboxymuconolactone decarboxylase family protein YurZ